MRTAYFDCISGLSGDMLLGALVDVGLDTKVLREMISSLGLEKVCNIDATRVLKNGISATQVIVELLEKKQTPRRLSDVKKIIRDSNLSNSIRTRSIRVFERLAKVEARIHGRSVEQVHFHEVGAVDSIVDIVGVVTGLEVLGITNAFSSPLPLGSGFIQTEHGNIPLPSPATVELLQGVPVYDSGVKGEMVTPTGAALLTEFVTEFGRLPSMKILASGFGAGTRDIPDRPNVLRVIIGEPAFRDAEETQTVAVLETNIDDSSPEFLAYLMERLLEKGALDVAFFPAQMKKNRPGVRVQVIAQPNRTEELSQIIFEETTTLGIRFRFDQRKVLARTEKMVESPWGKIRAKVVERKGKFLLVPEYEECRMVAKRHNIPLRKVYTWIQSRDENMSDSK